MLPFGPEPFVLWPDVKIIQIKIYKRVIWLVVLCGCETWSLSIRKENKLRIFENRVPRRIFGPNRDRVTRRWRELHKEDEEWCLLGCYAVWLL
jgi:hypothetical protein